MSHARSHRSDGRRRSSTRASPGSRLGRLRTAPTLHQVTHHRGAAPFDIPADLDMLERIVADAASHGGLLRPNTHWELASDRVGSLARMLDPLIGPIGMQPVDADAVACYEPFLRGIDHLGLCGPDLLAQGSARRWVKSDLGTLMDLNLTTAYLPVPMPHPLCVCEVGGGYGRLAEGFLGLLADGIHHVLIDAVPASLMYAYLYLRRAFPDRRIGSVYAGDSYDPGFDCFIMPAWQADTLPSEVFHLAVNIESMQEMDGHHVDHFLALFDRVMLPNGTIYVSNARDYVYRGEWRFPAHWEVLFQHNTPRSWSREHPTVVMRKGDRDHSLERVVQEAAYGLETAHWNPGLSMLRP